MVVKNLSIDQKIEIVVEKGSYQGTYLSKVADIKDDKIYLLAPYRKGELISLRPGSAVKINFTDEDAAYVFKVNILDREKNPIPMLITKKSSDIKRIQRRDFFRLDVTKKIKYCLIDKEENQLSDWQETTMLDISGGGLRMLMKEEIVKSDLFVLILLDIDDLEGIPVKGKIVNVYEKRDDKKAAGIEFVNLNPRKRDTIVGWIFDRQREMRKKGLL